MLVFVLHFEVLQKHKKLHHLGLVQDRSMGYGNRVFRLDSVEEGLEVEPTVEAPVLVLCVDKGQEVLFR